MKKYTTFFSEWLQASGFGKNIMLDIKLGQAKAVISGHDLCTTWHQSERHADSAAQFTDCYLCPEKN